MELLFVEKFSNNKPTNFIKKIKHGIKLHTIRRDKRNRWKVGEEIKIDSITLECVSIQQIEIRYKANTTEANIWIDGRYLGGYDTETKEVNRDRLKQFVLNDGFQSVEAFFSWFKEDFRGKVIHWTNESY